MHFCQASRFYPASRGSNLEGAETWEVNQYGKAWRLKIGNWKLEIEGLAKFFGPGEITNVGLVVDDAIRKAEEMIKEGWSELKIEDWKSKDLQSFLVLATVDEPDNTTR